jgi:ferredoxin-NADP reductase/MOSC domain-containing protein YiiM/ferredoxin
MNYPASTQPRLLSLNVGLPRDVQWQGEIVQTGIWKGPVEGPRMVTRLNVEGDGQGDLNGHGGVNRAVFVYQIESYRYWQQQLGRDDFVYGQFGENFTVAGMPDDEVCIGDRYRIGDAVFEVSQPRVTCYRLGLRMNEPRMPSLVVAHHRPGFYLRTIEEGRVQAGDQIEKLETGPEAMTVAEIDGLLYLPHRSRKALARAMRIKALSEGWQGSFRELLEQPEAASAGAGTTPPLSWTGLKTLRVESISPESADVVSIRLRAEGFHATAAPQPGQFLTLRVRPDSASAPLLRTYSLSGPPSASDYRISVKREPHGVASGYLHTGLRVGDAVEAGAPRGTFVLQPGTRPVVLISAGVGATPVLAMLHALALQPAPRPVWWLHAARDSSRHPFRAEVASLLAELPDPHRVICYSRPMPDDRSGDDYDVEGHLTAAVMDERQVPFDADFYMCGPERFMHDIGAALTARGAAPNRVRTEIFGADAAITPGVVKSAAKPPPHPPAGDLGTGPSVSFSRSNLAVPWDPEFRSVLEFAEACDVPVRWSCRTGVCHTCVTGLVSGEVRYDPEPLEPPDPGDVLICCCRPSSELVLDL